MAKTYIILHHSATPDGVTLKDFDAIKAEHLRRGYRDIGYHWVIEKVNGVLTAIPGRPESIEGAHCPGRNYDGIGVCCVGNFETEIPSEELYIFTANLCRGIMLRHPIKVIAGHRDYYATACPGKNFDMGKLRNYIKGGVIVEDKISCVINIKGNLFPGYTKGGSSYFGEGVPVRAVVEACNNSISWDEVNKVVNVK
jgi:N-acetylmuramoyl-L-alanine amidase